MRVLARALAASALLCVSSIAWSDETVSYSYDSKGRLIGVGRSGTVNNGIAANYCYDKADNRSQVTVSSGACTTGASPSAFSIGDASAAEGTAASVGVTRYGDTSTAQSISYATSGDTATSGVDFTPVSGTLTFAPGETAKLLSVGTVQDSDYESTEAFRVTLSAPTGGALIATGQATVLIVDDEPPIPPGFSVSDASASEGGSLIFTVTKSGTAPPTLSVNYATANGTAFDPFDFTATSGTLTFAPSETSKTIVIPAIDDTIAESTETMTLTLSAPTGGASLIDASGTGSITDNDLPPPSFAIASTAATEGGVLSFTVTKTGSAASSITIDYASADGSAAAPGDYGAVSGTLTFAPSDTSLTIPIATVDDTTPEVTETMTVNLSNPVGGATISQAQGVGTINDNDGTPPPTFSISDGGNTEGSPVTFTVSRAGATTGSAAVSYATATGSASSNDFTAVSGTLTFASGETSKSVTVPTAQDIRVEGDESFQVNLSGPTNGAVIGDGQGVGTIYDDDTGGDPCPNCRGTTAASADPASTDTQQPGVTDGPGL